MIHRFRNAIKIESEWLQSGGTEKSHENPVKISYESYKIRSNHRPNANPKLFTATPSGLVTLM
jgi:hypothetical protein